MMFQPPDIRVIGPDRYCPDCRRILLKMNEDRDTYTLSGKTHYVAQGSIAFNFEEEMPSEIEVIPDVFCMRPFCRFKRWRRKEKMPDSSLDENDSVKRASYVLAGATVLLAVVYLISVLQRIFE